MRQAADGGDEPVSFSVLDEPLPQSGPEPAAEPPSRLATRTRVLIALVGVLALAAAVAVQQGRRQQARPGTPAAASSPVSSSPSPAAAATGPVVSQAAGPLLDVPAGWQLFGRGPDSVVRIELARGRVTRTPVPSLSSSGLVSFVVGADRAIVRPLDFVPGYVVLDGHPVQELAGSAMKNGPMLPGPDPRHVWTPSQDNTVLRLTSLGGEQSSQLLPVEPITAFADQTGYAAFDGIGGVYDAGPHGVHRITTGALVAVGPTRWLTYDCDDTDACRLVLTDRRTNAKRTLYAPARPGQARGRISPDGNTAALIMFTEVGPRLRLLDLRTGTLRPGEVALDEAADESALVWSPDSRWLFAVGASGTLSVLDGRTGTTRGLGVALPPLTQLALRVG